MLMSSSPTFSFLQWAAFPPSSICRQRHDLVEMKEDTWKANRRTFKKKRNHSNNKKVTQRHISAARSTPLKPILKTFFVKLSLSPWQLHPKQHLQKQPEPNIPQKPITFPCNRLCVCVWHRGDCGSHSGEGCAVNALLGCFRVFFRLQRSETLTIVRCSVVRGFSSAINLTHTHTHTKRKKHERNKRQEHTDGRGK